MNPYEITIVSSDFVKNFMEDENISYFSFTLFNQSFLEIASFCSNEEWTSFYRKDYLPIPPVKKHIITCKKGTLWWDLDFYRKDVEQFIKDRNNVCGIAMSNTIVAKIQSNLCAVSFGSKIGQVHLMNLMLERQKQIEKIIHIFVSKSFVNTPMSSNKSH